MRKRHFVNINEKNEKTSKKKKKKKKKKNMKNVNCDVNIEANAKMSNSLHAGLPDVDLTMCSTD